MDPISTDPASGASRPIIAASIVDLPDPFGPANTVSAPGSIVVRRHSGAHPSRPWMPTSSTVIGSPATLTPRFPVADSVAASDCGVMSSKTCSAAVRPSVELWNCMPTRRSGRYASGARINAKTPAYNDISP